MVLYNWEHILTILIITLSVFMPITLECYGRAQILTQEEQDIEDKRHIQYLIEELEEEWYKVTKIIYH